MKLVYEGFRVQSKTKKPKMLDINVSEKKNDAKKEKVEETKVEGKGKNKLSQTKLLHYDLFRERGESKI